MGESVWLGLVNYGPNCQNSACDGLVNWIDGTDFTYDPSFMPGTIIWDDTEINPCLRLSAVNVGYAADRFCTNLQYAGLCQLQSLCGS